MCLHYRWPTGREHGRKIRIRVHSLSLGDLQSGRQLFLPLGPSILEPGLDLDLGQIQSLGQFHALVHAQVFVVLELRLQLLQLFRTVRLSWLPVNSGLPGSLARGGASDVARRRRG